MSKESWTSLRIMPVGGDKRRGGCKFVKNDNVMGRLHDEMTCFSYKDKNECDEMLFDPSTGCLWSTAAKKYCRVSYEHGESKEGANTMFCDRDVCKSKFEMGEDYLRCKNCSGNSDGSNKHYCNFDRTVMCHETKHNQNTKVNFTCNGKYPIDAKVIEEIEKQDTDNSSNDADESGTVDWYGEWSIDETMIAISIGAVVLLIMSRQR